MMKYLSQFFTACTLISSTLGGFANLAFAEDTYITVATCKDDFAAASFEYYEDSQSSDGRAKYRIKVLTPEAAQWFKSNGFTGSIEPENPDVMIMGRMVLADRNDKWFQTSATEVVDGVVDSDGAAVGSIETRYIVHVDTNRGEVMLNGIKFNNRIDANPAQTKTKDIQWVFKKCSINFRRVL